MHLVICGAGPVLVTKALRKDWGIQPIATQPALQILRDKHIDIENLFNLTSRSVVSEANAGERPLPIADAIIVAPATRNTIVQLASNGDADTKPSYAVVYPKYAIEARIPVVILPSIKRDIMTPDFLSRVKDLRNKHGGHQTPTHSLPQVIEGNIIVFMLYPISPYHVPFLKPYFSFNLLQRLPKLAVAVGACLAVAQNS